jgi:hypothetical protein
MSMDGLRLAVNLGPVKSSTGPLLLSVLPCMGNYTAEVEQTGIEWFTRWLDREGIPYVPITSKEDQLTHGDYYLFKKHVPTDLKTEERNPNGNLFAEEWSNYPVRHGWLRNLTECKFLVYIFLSTKTMYWVNFSRFVAYVDQHYTERNLVRQDKTEQKNDSQGYLVPIWKLREEGIIVRTDYLDEDES